MIKLIDVYGIDSNYNHTVNFNTQTEQLNYFFNNARYTFDDIDYVRKNNNIQLEISIDKLKYCNYLISKNENESIYNFYFIMDYIYINEDVTEIVIKLDVLQTYLFYINEIRGTLERKQFSRSELENIYFMETEDIDCGEMELIERYKIYDYKEKGGYVIASSERLGTSSEKRNNFTGTGGDGGDGENNDNCGDWENGVMSSNGYRFMKGYEGFGKYMYKDSGGVETIGYGVTRSELDVFNKLVANQPISEEMAAKEGYNIKIKNYGKPIVNKLKEIGITKQHQFDALCDVAFNGGTGLILGSSLPGSQKLIEAITKNPNDENYIRPIWENFWVNDNNGNTQQGLKDRRKAECDIYFNNKYEFRKIVTINADGSYGNYITENNGNGWLPHCENDSENPIKFKIKNELGEFQAPTTGTVTALYPSYPSGGYHNGNDIANELNTPIYSMTDGKVTISGAVSGFGHGIYVESNINGKTVRIRYGHMYKNGLFVKVGDTVKKGEKIALMGNDGESTGTHLHFDFAIDGNFINPSTNMKVGDIIK
ncbi:MAG: peptidoglycan DD-metalloendopeptidase family protein [Paraclostridium sp.]